MSTDTGTDQEVSEVAKLLSRYIGAGPTRMTQREVERRTAAIGMPVSQAAISLILTGRTLAPENETMRALSEVLDLDPEEVASALGRDRSQSFAQVRGRAVADLEEVVSTLSPDELDQLADVIERTLAQAKSRNVNRA